MAKQAPQQQPDYEPSPIIPIGEKKYLCVEYPGYVKRTKRALQTLGGEKGLAEALANNTTVELKYRPGDIFSHGIHGQILTTSKLLVKVTRRVKRKDRITEKEQEEEVEEDTEIKWKTEIKGVVTKTVRFRGTHVYRENLIQKACRKKLICFLSISRFSIYCTKR